jgi:hypothetical protein
MAADLASSDASTHGYQEDRSRAGLLELSKEADKHGVSIIKSGSYRHAKNFYVEGGITSGTKRTFVIYLGGHSEINDNRVRSRDYLRLEFKDTPGPCPPKGQGGTINTGTGTPEMISSSTQVKHMHVYIWRTTATMHDV